jgi:hypothetical protein
MRLLDVLDYQYSNGTEESVEVEYRLVSWGEIYPPFLGNREHSTAARFILRDFPFKLFSVSIPYSELPQKLCLSFRDPILETRTKATTSIGPHPDDAAKEFAAFLSLVTRRRVFPVSQTRINGLPTEEAVNMYVRSHSQERQQLKEIEPAEVYRLLKNLQRIDRHIAQGYMLSMRLYHSAVEMMYSEPEFAYLFLVMSLEAVASAVYTDLRPSDKGERRTDLDHYLDSAYPGWREHCDISTPEKRKQVIDMLLTEAYFVRRKFRKFVRENLPDTFWSETEDDAKPDYLSGIIAAGPDGMGREYIRHSDKTIQEWERIDKASLKDTLDSIYGARSKFVHEGVRFPASIVIGHFRRVPWGAFDELLETKSADPMGEEVFLDVPPLLTFERLVSYSLVGFLSKQGSNQ